MNVRELLVASVLAQGLACSRPARPPAVVPVAEPAPAVVPAGVVLASYRAPQGCPDEQAYVGSVESRSQTLQLRSAGAGEAADRLRVRIQPDTGSAGWIGVLQIEGEHALEREVRGERCEDVALALALIAVLRLEAGSAPAAAAALPAEAPPVSPLPPGPAPDTLSGAPLLPDSAVEIVRSERPRRDAIEVELQDVTQPRRSSGNASWQPSLAAHLGYVSAPSHALQARLRAELQLGPRVQSGSLALGFGYAGASHHADSADLDFGLITAQLVACPLGLGSASWLRACAGLSGGVLAVSVQALDDDLDSQSASRAWVAVGPSLEAGLPLSSAWTLRVLAEGSVLLVRDRFEVERIVGDEAGQPSQITRTLLYRPPLGSYAASLGLGYRF